jgi:hypothetical protein
MITRGEVWGKYRPRDWVALRRLGALRNRDLAGPLRSQLERLASCWVLWSLFERKLKALVETDPQNPERIVPVAWGRPFRAAPAQRGILHARPENGTFGKLQRSYHLLVPQGENRRTGRRLSLDSSNSRGDTWDVGWEVPIPTGILASRARWGRLTSE